LRRGKHEHRNPGAAAAFSRTNRVLNDTKPYGNILDFRQQQEAVDAAISLFSGQTGKAAREIWLVDKTPVVIDKLQTAVQSTSTSSARRKNATLTVYRWKRSK
jgi:type I restriction enzyme R subunit